MLNILSTERGDGKSLITEHLAAFFREADMKVRIVSWNKDFDIERKEYLLAEKLGDFVRDTPGEVPLAEADVVLVEYPPFATSSVPKELLRHAALSIVIAPANRTWKDTDQLLFEKAEKLSGRTPSYSASTARPRRGANLHGPDASVQPPPQVGVSDQPVRVHGRQINSDTSWNATAA